MSAPASISWFARHELSLFWRDFVTMMTAGKPRRQRGVIIFILVALIALHMIAWLVLTRALSLGGDDVQARLALVTGMIVLAFSLMGSQAMESVTRAFYSRSDLDLILSSPASIPRLFAVRIGAIALSTTMLSFLLALPAVNVLAIIDTPRWLAAYPFIFALGAVATVFALSLTILLFRTIGAKRTRAIAQIAAALVGAAFIIGVQLAAIASMGTISRISFLNSDTVRAWSPGPDDPLWLPAKAAMGDPFALALSLLIAIAALWGAVRLFSGGFSEKVLAAAGLSEARGRRQRSQGFRTRSISAALRFKEWKLLARDHWLISQTLMQILYLIPPAFMLWQGFGTTGAVPTVVIPVLVMATGQLSGGLAWLAISGEDAPQLVATAPVSPFRIIRAKVEAVLSVILLFTAPILLAIAWLDVWLAFVALASIFAAAVSATAIQLWFKSQAKRSNFRRRQTSSRMATFAEAFSSIFWAGFAALWANNSIYCLVLAGGAITVILFARAMRPNPKGEFAH